MIIWLPFSIMVYSVAFLVSKAKSSEVKIIGSVLLSIILSLMISLGGSMMTDYPNYEESYYSMRNISFHEKLTNSNFEFGYNLFSVTCQYLGLSFQAALFLFSGIANYLLITFFLKTKYPVFSIMLFVFSYYPQEANLIRQMFAISIFLSSIHYLVIGKKKKFAILILFTSLFHNSALFLILLLFIDFKKISISFLYSMVIVWGISLLSAIGILSLVNPIVNSLSSFSFFSQSNLYSSRFDSYVLGQRSIGGDDDVNIIMNVVALILLFLLVKWDKLKTHKQYKLYFILFVFSVILNNLKTVLPVFQRLSLYFACLYPVIIPIILFITLYKINFKSKTQIISSLAIFFTIFSALKKYFSDDIQQLGAVFLDFSKLIQ